MTPRGWEESSPAQGEMAKQFFDQHDAEEGLSQLRQMDPEAARQFEREGAKKER
jgi:hypothetical protein